MKFGPRRARWIEIRDEMETPPLSEKEIVIFERFDLVYRTLCAILYNYVPTSGHPGGSISSGRFVASLLFDTMEYDLSDPDRTDADIISYAAGHKALGLYAMWALRNEIARISAPHLLPVDEKKQLRLEDLLGFRRNPTNPAGRLFREFRSKALDGHPTPATPFIRLATGASGVGVATSLGLALASADLYGDEGPRVHIVEGEGGLTPGRVAESLAFAGTASLQNAILHIDWNQSSIDSDRVTREGANPGDYVQWDPAELCYLHDWNVILVPDGRDFQQIIAAQRRALAIDNHQPTAIVYRTKKGWQYGIEGKASHGAGHKLCSAGFYQALHAIDPSRHTVPACAAGEQRCAAGTDGEVVEACFWESLSILRSTLEDDREVSDLLAERLVDSRERVVHFAIHPKEKRADVSRVFAAASRSATPDELRLQPDQQIALRGQLGKVLDYLNKESGGALFIAAADLLGSTSVLEGGKSFPSGYFNAATNPGSRILSVGGICEDAITGVLAGATTFGGHIGVGSSYAAFIAPLGHIATRLHAIGAQARHAVSGEPYRPFILVCAHAGLKTGEDGPTHADPQPLQLLQENFPRGTAITLTPWEPQEIWPLMAAALSRRPAMIAPFVTRPAETVFDRAARGLAPAEDAAKGVYLLRRARGNGDVTIVLQESGAAYEFVRGALPLLERNGIDANVYYVSSAELFDLLPPDEQEAIFPEHLAMEAMGITGFTLPTMYRWVRSEAGRRATLHPYRAGHYPGSGAGEIVLGEAGLDGRSQFEAIVRYMESRALVRA